ncbi:uncharacterized protein abca12 [Betta splendens]|uniref:Uncharacterized protein abca12 n=1 Tax=Betta splendens TaxID=158456 RepID=A0A6P7LCQ1_BETSP|nr:uncharacterized protein abca12 [Betta splendens]XP_055361099.1 uncharacterized protein abca12 [Betta splendens]
MAFFRQLRLLLWKNALSAVRQPLWTLTLLAWPLIIFLIILVTRLKFPPIQRETCYVSPRNLPSAGFFPFLQTLMCNTDSKCRNTSSLVDPTDPKTFANTRSSLLQRSAPLVNLFQGGNFFSFPENDPGMDHTQVALILNRVFGSAFPDSINNISLGNNNDTFLGNQEALNSAGSVNPVKRAFCTVTLPMINSTSSHPLNYAVASFCSSNTSVFEASLLTLNQVLTDLMLTKPNETVAAAEQSVFVFDQLQNDTSLWESLLQVPQLFSSSSDQVLNNTKFLLSNLQGAVNAIQDTFLVGNDSLSSIRPLLVGGISTIHYVQNWPGKGVSIPLGQIVTLQNDSLSVMAKAVLQEVRIPLDKAIGLTLDKNIVHSYLCDNSSSSLLLTAACATGTVNMVLSWISPDLVAKQALLAWSKDVAPHDVSFIKAMLQSLTGGLSPGGQGGSNNARRRRSVDTQPQSIEEELFLSVGEVVMEILQVVPEVDAIVQKILTTGFQTMKTATQTLNTVAEIISNSLKDADQLQLTYVELMTNETQASIWINRILDSVAKTVIQTLESESLTCEDLLSPFKWLLNTESVTAEVWKSVICQNSTLQQALLSDWQLLAQETQDMYNNLTGQEDVSVTLPSILAEWQKLANSSLQIQKVFETLITNLDGEYWMNWILDNSTVDVYDTFLQSSGLFVEFFGENIETTELWPDIKDYFYMAYWILSYTPGVTTPPANCSVNYPVAIHCDTGLNWSHFTEVVRAALLSPDKALVNSIEGALNFLQYVYADVYKNRTASFLKQEPDAEGALSAIMGNLTHNPDDFFQNISILPFSNLSKPDIMCSLLHNLVEPTGLSPLLTPLLSNSPVNVSTVLDIASKLGRIYQPIYPSNETDPTMLDLEQLIKQFLSLEGNLTLPISHAMGYSLLNCSEYFSLNDVISLTKAFQPFINQSNQTSGLVETIISAIELWKTVMDSPNNDPANITLAYIQQLRKLTTSLFRLQSLESYASSSEQLIETQINQISEDFVNFISPEMLKNLTDVGPDAALSIVIQMFEGFLPPEVQKRVAPLFMELRGFVSLIIECATNQNCSTQVSEIFSFLNQIVEMMSPANANVTHEMLSNNTILEETKFDEIASMLFSLLLSHSNETNMGTVNQTLQFIRMIMAEPNISVSEIQNALEQSNLTLEQLEDIAELAQAVNISKLLDDMMEICNAKQCFEPQQDSMETAKCVMELIDAISSFLGQLPDFCNETAIFLNIPLVINDTISDIIQDNSSSSPNVALMQTLKSILANIRMNLDLNQLNTPEIMWELDVLEGLIQLFANTEEPFNSTSMMDPFDAQKVYLEIVEWYLKRLENITSNSSISDLIHPFFCITQMQITLQLAQTDFSSFVSNQYILLMNSLQYPIDDAGVSKIGKTVVEVLEHLFDLITFDLEVQNASLHSDLFNRAILNATGHHIKQYLELLEKWTTQPNVSLALSRLFLWGNSSMNVSMPMTDIQQLLKSLDNFDELDDELIELSVINNITQCLKNALMLAEVPGGLQSDDFLNAVLDAVKYVMQTWTGGTEDLPVSTQEDILDILSDSLQVIVQPGVSFASPRNISLLILKTAETTIRYTAPDTFSNYIMYGLQVATTYFESTSTSGVPDDWSEMILKEMKTVQGFLPPNSAAQAYISVLIDITNTFLESYPDNMRIWSGFENATEGNVSLILDQMTNALWPVVKDGPGSFRMKASPLKSFADLPSFLEMVMTEKADEDTWENLQEMLASLLSTLDGTELWGNTSFAISRFEIMIETLVNVEQAQNEMILSLQMLLLTLMEEVAQHANNTHLNLSDVSDKVQLALQNMTNGTLECDEVLTDWEPVREAAGISHAAMAMVCNIRLQPVLGALTAAQTLYPGLNMSSMGAGPVNASDAAARIVNTVQSLYEVSVNQTLVTVQLIGAFSNQLSMLASQPLSPEAQLYWNQQLQDMYFRDSLSSTNFQLPDEVLNMGPYIIPYIRAIAKALNFTLNNYFTTQNRSTSDELFEEAAATTFLTSVNTTLDNLLSMLGGNLTGLNESTIADMAWEGVKLLNRWQAFKKDPTIYQALQQFLKSESKKEILLKIAKICTWLGTIESNMTSDNMILGYWSRLNDTSFSNMMREAVNLLSDQGIFGDKPMVYEALGHFLKSTDKRATLKKVSKFTALLASIHANITSNISMISGNWSGFNETFFTNTMWEEIKLLTDKEVFGDERMIYQALGEFLKSNDRSVILPKITEINRWLAFIEANINSDNNFPSISGNWFGLNETSFATMTRKAVELLSEQQLFREEPMIYQAMEQFLESNDTMATCKMLPKFTAWLASKEANITSGNFPSMIYGNWLRLNDTCFTNVMREAMKLLSEQKIFGDQHMIYQALEQFVASSDQRVDLQKVSEFTAWFTSIEGNCPSNNISMIWGNWSGLDETPFTKMMREAVKQIFGDEPMVHEALEQFLESMTNDKREILQTLAALSTQLSFTEANITIDNIFYMIWGNWSRLNDTSFTNMMKEAVKLLSDHTIFGDEPMVYQALEQFLESNDKMATLTMLAEIIAWLASNEANITSNNISMIWGNCSGLNEASFNNFIRKAVKLLSEQNIFGVESMIYQALEQFLESGEKRVTLTVLAEFTVWLASIEANITSNNNISKIWGNWSRLNDTTFTNMMKEAVKLLSVLGHEPMIYQTFEQILESNDKIATLTMLPELTALLASIEANVTSNNIFMMWENCSGFHEALFANLTREAVKLLSEQKIFGDQPIIYQALEQFVASTDQRVVLQKVSEFTALLASIEANCTSNNISRIWGNWSGLNETPFTKMMREVVNLLSEQQIFEDEPMVYEAWEQFLESKNESEILQTLAEICTWLAFTEANITSHNRSMIWRNWSGLNDMPFTNMMKEAVKLLSDQKIFGDEAPIYQALEKFLTSNDKRVILQTIAEIRIWLASIEANITSNNIFSVIWGNWSELNETSFTNIMREVVKLLSEQKIFGNEPMIYQALEKFVAHSNQSVFLQKVSEFTASLASIEANGTSDNISRIWGNWSGLNETPFTKIIREVVNLLSDQQIFRDETMFYETLEQFLESCNERKFLQTVAEICTWLAFTESNITSNNLSMTWGNWSGLSDMPFTNMMKEAVKLLSEQQIFGVEPSIYQTLEQLLISNGTFLVQRGEEFSARLTSTDANITSDIIFSIVWEELSGLTGTRFVDMTKKAVKLMSDIQIFGDRPMIYEDLDQFLTSSNTSFMVNTIVEFMHSWLPFSERNSSSDIYSMLWGEFSTLNETRFTNMTWEAVKLMKDLRIFGDTPMVYQILGSNDTSSIVQKVAEMSVWLVTTEASGLELLNQALPKIYDIVKPIFSVLKQMSVDAQGDMELYEELAENVLNTLMLLGSNRDLLLPMDLYQGVYQQESISNYTAVKPMISPLLRDPMDDLINLFSINYHAMFQAIAVPPTTEDLMETAHVFFNNPNLNVVLKGASVDIPWGLNASREETIDAALGMLSSLTTPDTSQKPFMYILTSAVDMLPDEFPFSSLLKNITRALAKEYQENLNLTNLIIQTVSELSPMNLTDPQFTEQLDMLRSQVCALESSETVGVLMSSLSMEPGLLCDTFLPSLEILFYSVIMNMTSLTESIVQAVIGDPNTYNIQPTWASVLSETWGINISSLSDFLNISISSPGKVTVGKLLRNETAFVLEVQQRMNFDPAVLSLLMNTTLPDKNVEILTWLVNLRHCGSTPDTPDIILQTFCSFSVEQWYTFSLLMARYIDTEEVFYRVVLSEDLQSVLEVMLIIAKSLADMMERILPAIGQLQNLMLNIQDLNLMANNEFKQMTRGRRSISSQATFSTLSRAMCSNSMKSLFDIIKPTTATQSTYFSDQNREDLMNRFNIPRNATPFCTNLYLDMVSTTEGAVAWAFLKPMLMGQILFTPDTPVTRSIMEKANATLHEFANLRKNSEDWIKASNYIFESSAQLSSTLPMLQSSLANSFVKNFIEMHTDINVDRMKETLSSFSNMTLMLETNKYMVKQITALSNLMVDVSSCVTFDRYRGFDSADELNTVAQELAKTRDLYASVIFKLPKEQDSSTSRPSRSLSPSSLPPQVSYTIRMHMENAMRTDRVREPFYVKDTYIIARRTMRYNRGFLYLQESIDRAIIEAQVGQRVTEPAVQLQPFPYPCFHRDEFLQAMSYVFPVMLMTAWVLFVADFVRRLVHERELRLHEYMKMMGVNPLSHFFAWFIECATQLLITTFILTLMLKYGKILPNSDGFLLFLYLCDYGLSTLAFSYLVSSFFDKTYIAGLSGSLLYILCFFPYIMVIALETNLTLSQKSALGLFAPTCFSYASQYVSRYETQGEGIQWSNAYTSPVFGDTASFGWLCWLMLIDSILYFIIGGYIRMVFPGKYGIPAPWYFPFTASFWSNLCCSAKSESKVGKGLLITNILQRGQYAFDDDKGKGESTLSTQAEEDYSQLPVGVSLYGLSKLYGNRAAIENLNVSFYEGHVTSLLGHNGAGKTTTMSLLTGLFPPTSGTIEVYGRDMQANVDDVRKELGVCMQYDVLFDHLTTEEHLLLYAQVKAPHWSAGELHEQVRSILEETGMHAHRHKLVGTLSGGMKRKLSISIAFIGGSRLVVLDEPTTGVDPCSRRSIWDIVIQNKRHRTIIMSTHHLDEAEVLSDRIAFLERGGLKCCGSPFYLKDKLGQGYKLTLTKKPQMKNIDSEPIDNATLKSFVQAHVPEARLKETQGSDLVYSLPPFTSSNSSSYRSLLTALDSNLDALQLGGYGISDTTLEEVFLQLTREAAEAEGGALSISETLSDTASVDSFSSDLSDNTSNFSDRIKLTGSSVVQGLDLAWQQMTAMLIKRFHHSRRDWKGLMAQIVLPVLFMVFAMSLGSIKNDLKSYPALELSPALYNIGPSYSFFRNLNPKSSQLADTMTSFPGMDNACLDNPNNAVCQRSTNSWTSSGNSSKPFDICKCKREEQLCEGGSSRVPHKQIPSSQIVYNISPYDVETYLLATTNEFIRNRYGGFDFGLPLPSDLQMDLLPVPKNRTLSKVWYNPEGHHTMPAYLNSLNNFILRSNLPADKDPRTYAISVSSHPYFGREDDDDIIIQGMLQILVAMCVLTGYSITTTSFAIYEVKEHHSGSKRLQHIAGISEPFYWTVNFLYDMFVYMIPVTLTLGVIAAFQIPAFTDRLNLAAIALLLVLFGFATFPWMYLLSEVFKDAEMAFITYVCINLFISVNTIMSSSVLYFLSQLTTRNAQAIKDLCEKLSRAFLIFPQFNFGNGLMELARMNIQVQVLSGYGIDAYKNPFSTDGLGWMFIASFIQGVVFFTLRLLLNKTLIRKVRSLICGKKAVPLMPTEGEGDEDVAAEHLRVSSGAASADILQVNQLTKVYQHLKKKVFAVKRVSVGIPAGECFGLLGVNGAGKTTTFKMLTGDVSPTGGTAQIKDWDGRLVDIMECRNKGINIGYCPQVDALDGLLTGEEHLYFYARVRGVSKKEVTGVVNYLLTRLELNYHKKIISDSYSCGTRRKLSTALALIGHPQILLLDEPSSGMDPRTKRHLWKIISEEVKGKCAVVLTSHSMEECEALCSRLAIMVKGQFRCLGSLQHIKNRFGSGFTVKMYLAKTSSDAAAITRFMQRQFPSTYLKDQHSNMVEYHIPSAPGGVADIFDQLESNKNALQIKHFSVSQTTLDEVFINFATEKIEM